MRLCVWGAVVLVGACVSPNTSTEDPTVGNDALGVAQFQTTESDNELVIKGLDHLGKVVAEYRIYEGMVELQEEESFGQTVEGRRLEMTVAGRKYVRASEGTEPVNLAFWRDDSDSFVSDPYVSQVLARWGITYQPVVDHLGAHPDDEAAYFQWCSTGSTGCNAEMITSCSNFWSEDEYHPEGFYRCQSNPNNHWRNFCGYSYLEQTPCGPAGPQGCGSCGSWYNDPPLNAVCQHGNACGWYF